MKRALFIAHRWLGIALGAFMLLWFLSGLVMVYSGSTTVTQQQRLAHAQAIPVRNAGALLSAADAWQLSGPQRGAITSEMKQESHAHDYGRPRQTSAAKPTEQGVAEAHLSLLNDVPVWQLVDEQGRRYALSALNGEVQTISMEAALRVAKTWGGDKVSPRALETVEKDLLTRRMVLDAYRPFHKVSLNDEAGTVLDISSRTGEVVNATTRVQRVLAYAGEWLHFFRFLDSVGLEGQRRTILIWTSFIACIGVLSGLIVGWQRWRPGWFGTRTYPRGRSHPYRESWPRWHFWSGLLGGILTLAWMVSGYLVSNPWQIFSKAGFSQQELLRFQGGPLPQFLLAVRPESLIPRESQTVEVSLRRMGDWQFAFAYGSDGKVQTHDFVGSKDISQIAFLDGARRLLPKAGIRNYALLADHDDYYYPNHRKHATDRPLPVLRVDFDDPAATRIYVDPVEGQPVLRIDNSRRTYRWLFYALHNWDLGVLYSRPVWDVWMVFWSLVGLTLSITSLWLGWRRLRIGAAKSKPATLDLRPMTGAQGASSSRGL